MGVITIEQIKQAVEAEGLALRGGFHCTAEDAVPDQPDGRPARTLLLCGNVGSSIWPTFSNSPEAGDGEPHALNRWSERVLSRLARELKAAAHFPFGGPPYVPFLGWAKRAEDLENSPLGMLIHPRFGLWHAYRGALAFAEKIDLPVPAPAPSPCESCEGRPCLSACPVGAFDGARYDVDGCARHIAGASGSDCLSLGCRARRACPVGREYLYLSDQAEFHMRAFLKSRQQERPEL